MNFLSKQVIAVAVGCLVLVVLVGGGFFYFRAQQAKTPQNQEKAAQDQVKKVVAEVGKLMNLPTGEDPTVATVTDITKLKDQPFFQKAKNGDQVLIYANAKKAILYDPNTKKIVDVAPINIGSSSAQVAGAEKTVQPKIVLRNGTATLGLTAKAEIDLKKSYPDLNVVNKENAANTDYQKTVVVVLNDSGKDLGAKLAKSLNTEITNIPQAEIKPAEGDILIILGKDRI